jgi:hypothetical protein
MTPSATPENYTTLTDATGACYGFTRTWREFRLEEDQLRELELSRVARRFFSWRLGELLPSYPMLA